MGWRVREAHLVARHKRRRRGFTKQDAAARKAPDLLQRNFDPPPVPNMAPTAEERKVLDAYLAASVSNDMDAIAGLLTSDVVLTMPPNPFWSTSREAMMGFFRQSLDLASPAYFGEWKHLPTLANRMPAAAGYVRRPGTTVYRAQVLDVLRVRDGRIAEITSFEPHLFAAFGLPLVIR